MSSSVNARVFLWLGLVLALWLNYDAWMRDYGPKPGEVVQSAADAGPVSNTSTLEANIPTASAPSPAAPAVAPAPAPLDATPIPAAVAGAEGEASPAAAVAATPAVAAASTPISATIDVRTDVLDLEIGLAGGELRRADLLRYPLVKGQERPVRLFNREVEAFYVMQTGLAGAGPGNYPTHLANFSAAQQRYALADGANELRVPLTWSDPATGVTVTKTYVLRRGQYAIDLEYSIENAGSAPWAAASYAQILRDDIPKERSMFNVETYAFKGPAFYDGNKYHKISLKDAADVSGQIKGGWIAGMQHHFVAAVVPSDTAEYRYSMKVDGRQYLLSTAGPLQQVAPGTTATLQEKLFVGPKLQAQLERTGPRLDLVADYGMLTLLAKPLFWLLEQAHKLTGNWGWAIILITALLKLVFYPLSEASGKSMAKMRVLAPRIKNLQETYKDDREKLGKAMMEMYQREKINPLAGCLPILVQMPVFFAFYWVLLESVEMRQAPFMGWIQDLSAKDPLFVLPIIMAVAMFVQYKLNPAPPDPIQAKVFMILPLVMSVTFAFFPAGLVLYWVTNTILSIAQQWNINRRIEAAAKKGKAAAA
ncbi:MAG: membrane protein insertase YidC [Sinobacteraceae bacterium]|nr:membrane protein insertase YidC [Nevskiaceae bacterium]MCP5338581.1 membrane protein insertase YidC [Nevskiaceae bacterium]MCP5466741.1 membrane protein insertase YidC [Nevskiaceae bacterium]MCP5470542.1 membrane protein insertase YidC [Nevskiaceae bacterium]